MHHPAQYTECDDVKLQSCQRREQAQSGSDVIRFNLIKLISELI